MALYSQDMSEYTVSVQPSDWTNRWSTDWTLTAETSSSIGGKYFKINPGGNARKFVSWDDIDSDADRDDTEILVRIASSSVSDYSNAFYIFLRGSGASASETAYDLQYSAGNLLLHKYVSGASTTLVTATGLYSTFRTNRNIGQRYNWMRFRANGTSLKGKIWSEVEVEPDGWQVETTDSAISAAGWVGAGNYNALGTAYLTLDYFGVGTNGDSPSMPTWATDAEVQYNQGLIEVARAFSSPAAEEVNSPLICINT